MNQPSRITLTKCLYGISAVQASVEVDFFRFSSLEQASRVYAELKKTEWVSLTALCLAIQNLLTQEPV